MSIWVGADFDAAEWAAWWPALQATLPGERLLRERTPADAQEIDIALVANPPAGSLRSLPALRLVQSLWAGSTDCSPTPTCRCTCRSPAWSTRP